MHEIFKVPTTSGGFVAYASLGLFGVLALLLVGTMFPSIIPTSVAGTKF